MLPLKCRFVRGVSGRQSPSRRATVNPDAAGYFNSAVSAFTTETRSIER